MNIFLLKFFPERKEPAFICFHTDNLIILSDTFPHICIILIIRLNLASEGFNLWQEVILQLVDMFQWRKGLQSICQCLRIFLSFKYLIHFKHIFSYSIDCFICFIFLCFQSLNPAPHESYALLYHRSKLDICILAFFLDRLEPSHALHGILELFILLDKTLICSIFYCIDIHFHSTQFSDSDIVALNVSEFHIHCRLRCFFISELLQLIFMHFDPIKKHSLVRDLVIQDIHISFGKFLHFIDLLLGGSRQIVYPLYTLQ